MFPAPKPREDRSYTSLSSVNTHKRTESNIPVPSMNNHRKSSSNNDPTVLLQSRINKVIWLQDDFNNGVSQKFYPNFGSSSHY